MDVIHNSTVSIKNALKNGEISVAVYGLGHTGLAISVAWLDSGAKVAGVDINDDVVSSINKGVSPIRDEPGIPEAVNKYCLSGRFRATVNGVEASETSDVKIIAVPTVLTRSRKCDLSTVKQALRSIAEGLRSGNLVILESSVPPTTTINIAKPILENESNLRTETDFGLAYSPERVFEGRILEDIEKRYPKVVGGVGPKSTETAAALYELIAKQGVIKTTSPTVAEMSKLFEGIYRDVNIALANELARFCGALGIDFSEVRGAANSQPFCHLHVPGFVGGWCIPFYPHFVLQVANERNIELPLTKLARKINEDKPQLLIRVADSMLKKVEGKGLSGSRVAILGLAFRGDVADTRNSPSYEVINLILEKGIKSLSAYDPYVARDAALEKKGVQLTTDLDNATRGADLIVVMTDHSSFKNNLKPVELLRRTSTPSVLIDGRNILPSTAIGTRKENLSHERIEGFSIFIKLV